MGCGDVLMGFNHRLHLSLSTQIRLHCILSMLYITHEHQGLKPGPDQYLSFTYMLLTLDFPVILTNLKV